MQPRLQQDVVAHQIPSKAHVRSTHDNEVGRRHRDSPRPQEEKKIILRGQPYTVDLNTEKQKTSFSERVRQLRDLGGSLVSVDNQHDAIRRIMCPLTVGLPTYEDELLMKQLKNEAVVLTHLEALAKFSLKKARYRNHLYVRCRPVIPSPVQTAYRSVDEFSIQKGVDGDPRTVGFFIGSPTSKETDVVCVPPDSVDIIKSEHKLVASAFQDFLRRHSALEPLLFSSAGSNGGHWRTITVRSNRKGETLAMVSMHPQSLTTEDLSVHKRQLANHLGPIVTSLYMSVSPSANVVVPELICGQSSLEEVIQGRRFLLGPTSALPLNVACFDGMLDVIRSECVRGTKRDILIDLFCGIGVTSVLLAPLVGQVYGLNTANDFELAERNADMNGVQNVEFTCMKGSGRRDIGLTEVSELLDTLSTSTGNEITVLMRLSSGGGVDHRLLEELRISRKVSKLVVLATNPEGNGVSRNLYDLCRLQKKGFMAKKGLFRQQFNLKHAYCVDSCPGTGSCDHVFVLTRPV